MDPTARRVRGRTRGGNRGSGSGNTSVGGASRRHGRGRGRGRGREPSEPTAPPEVLATFPTPRKRKRGEEEEREDSISSEQSKRRRRASSATSKSDFTSAADTEEERSDEDLDESELTGDGGSLSGTSRATTEEPEPSGPERAKRLAKAIDQGTLISLLRSVRAEQASDLIGSLWAWEVNVGRAMRGGAGRGDDSNGAELDADRQQLASNLPPGEELSSLPRATDLSPGHLTGTAAETVITPRRDPAPVSAALSPGRRADAQSSPTGQAQTSMQIHSTLLDANNMPPASNPTAGDLEDVNTTPRPSHEQLHSLRLDVNHDQTPRPNLKSPPPNRQEIAPEDCASLIPNWSSWPIESGAPDWTLGDEINALVEREVRRLSRQSRSDREMETDAEEVDEVDDDDIEPLERLPDKGKAALVKSPRLLDCILLRIAGRRMTKCKKELRTIRQKLQETEQAVSTGIEHPTGEDGDEEGSDPEVLTYEEAQKRKALAQDLEAKRAAEEDQRLNNRTRRKGHLSKLDDWRDVLNVAVTMPQLPDNVKNRTKERLEALFGA